MFRIIYLTNRIAEWRTPLSEASRCTTRISTEPRRLSEFGPFFLSFPRKTARETPRVRFSIIRVSRARAAYPAIRNLGVKKKAEKKRREKIHARVSAFVVAR